MNEIFTSFVIVICSLLILWAIYFVFKPRKRAVSHAKEESGEALSKGDYFKLYAFADGKPLPLESVKDNVFNSLTLGDGIAIIPKANELYAPCDALVTSIADTNHAVNLKCDNGIKILLHIGIDTVNLKGRFFTRHIKEGTEVKKGSKLISFELDKIKYLKYDPTICMAIYGDKKINMIKNTDAVKSVTSKDVILAIKEM